MTLNLNNSLEKQVIETRRVIRNIQRQLPKNKVFIWRMKEGYNTIIGQNVFYQCDRDLTNKCLKEKFNFSDSQFYLLCGLDEIKEHFKKFIEDEKNKKIDIILDTIRLLKNAKNRYSIFYEINCPYDELSKYEINVDIVSLTIIDTCYNSDDTVFDCSYYNFGGNLYNVYNEKLNKYLERWDISELKRIYDTTKYKLNK